MAANDNAPAANGGVEEMHEAGSFNPNDTAVAVDMHEAQRFLDLVDESGEAWHFRTFDDHGRGSGKNYAGTLADHATALQIDNGNGRGVFVVVNDGGGKDAEVHRVRAIFADFDGTALPDAFPIEPHVIVESSPGKWHVYWLVDGLAVAQFKPLQQAIAARFNSDPSVCNPSRVMRLPGFVHHKGEPFRTRIVHESGGVPYAPERAIAAFPAPAAAPPRQAPTSPAGDRVVHEERHGDLLKLAARFARHVHFDGLGIDAAMAALFAEAARGRWTREVPADEIQRAFDGALVKCRRGEWRQTEEEAAEPPALRLIEVEVGDVRTAEIAAPRFVAYPIIPRGHPTLLGGHGGTGKSNLAETFCAHAACGRPWGGFEFDQCKAVFVSLEDSGALVRFRLRRIVETYRLDPGLIAANLRIFDGTDAEAALMTEVNEFGSRKLMATPTMTEVENAAAGAGLIVIDNASDAFDGDENNRRQVRTFVRRLAGIAKENDAGLVLLAHIDKAAARNGSHGNSYSGSTAWHNSARSRLALVADEGVIELRHEKCNLAKVADPLMLGWNDAGVLIPLARGSSSAGGDESAKGDANAVLEVIRVALAAGITVPTGMSGPSTAWHALQPLPELGQEYRAKDGKRRVHAAMIRLGREGRIVRGTFKTTYRNERECWELPQVVNCGEKIAAGSAAHISPIPPSALPQRRGRAVVTTTAPTSATSATSADQCPRCDGEGCRHCREG